MTLNAGHLLLFRPMLPTENHIVPLVLFYTVLLLFFSSSATAHVEKGDMPDSVAEMEYRILLEFKPNNLEVRNKLGMVLYRSGKFDEAASEFNYVLKKDPDNINALTSLGRVNLKLLNYTQAVTLLQKAVSLNPVDMHIYYYLGQTFEMQGDLAKAEEVYAKGLSLEIQPSGQFEEDRKALAEALKNLHKDKEKTMEHN